MPRRLSARAPLGSLTLRVCGLPALQRVALARHDRMEARAAERHRARGLQHEGAAAAAGLGGRAAHADLRGVDALLELRRDALGGHARRGARGVGRRRRRRDVGGLDVDEHVLAVGRRVVGALTAAGEVGEAVAHLQRVVAGLAVDGVADAGARVEPVVAEAAEVRVGLVAAGEGVVAGAAVGHHRDQGAEARGGGERVVAAEPVELEHLGRGDVEAERDEVGAVEADLAARGLERHRVALAAHVRLDPVEAVVAVEVVGGVAVVPHERVVTRAAVVGVVALVAGDAVGAGAAAERVDARAAVDQCRRRHRWRSCRCRSRRRPWSRRWCRGH